MVASWGILLNISHKNCSNSFNPVSFENIGCFQGFQDGIIFKITVIFFNIPVVLLPVVQC